MSEPLTSVKVLNGEVKKGDMVAYASRTGSHLYMCIAKINLITESPSDWPLGPQLHVTVMSTSGYMTGRYDTTLRVLDRVVKLNPDPPPAPTVELNCTSATTQLAASVRSRYSSAALRTSARIGFTA